MMATKRGGDVADLSALVDEQMPRFDALRADGLDRLATIRRGRQAGLERERRRLEAWAGADDPRLAAVDRTLAGDRALAIALRVEAERATTPPPDVGKGESVIYGRVLSEKLVPVPDLVVTAHLPDGKPLDALGRACTDERGAFRLAGTLAREKQQPALHVRVHDADGKLLHDDDRSLTLEPEDAAHLEIVLGKPPRPCPPERGKG